ncbi:MAG: lipid-A-disaccharide synthase [Prevotellaceae bacterium]|jgi:lipid-A-disaccharide synthase|nr:lipid-A-disaccharide synthase [Prevotellaceae bacterium]
MKYYIIAGEASGDLHGSNLMKGLNQADSEADFRFWGGDLMVVQGGVMVKHYKETAFMGFWEVFKNFGTVRKNLKICKQDILDYAPDVVILIDYPGFNFRIAEFAHNKGLKVFYYIAPKVWAWKESRVKRLQKFVDKLFIIFPFEVDYFKKWGIEAYYAGNPLIDLIEDRMKNKVPFLQFVKHNKLDNKPIVALLAGSRKQEVSYILPRLVELSKYYPDYQFVVAGAPSLDKSLYQKYLSGTDVKYVHNKAYELMMHATAAVVASGTATLEALLFNVPQVVCYGGNELSYWIAKIFVKIKYVSLVNIIAEREVVFELIQHDMALVNIKNELDALLPGGEKREKMLKNYDEIRIMLGEPGASYLVAQNIVNELIKQL